MPNMKLEITNYFLFRICIFEFDIYLLFDAWDL